MNVLKTVWNNPWYLQITFLSLLVVISSFFFNPVLTLSHAFASVLITVLTDATIRRIKFGSWSYPVGATVSGLIISIALPLVTPIYIVILTALIAMILKNVVRINGIHVFNPANLGLLVIALINPGLTWWAMVSPWIMVLFFITMYKVRRYSVMISFLVLFSLLELLKSNFDFISLSSALLGILFWMMIMIVEPVTSPPYVKSQIIFGLIIAVVAFALIPIIPNYFMLGALAIADLFVPFLEKYVK